MGKRILCIDDDRTIRNILQRWLEEDGHLVSLAVNGEEGLKRALESKYDLIITDVMMPKMDGYDLCEALRKHPSTRLTPLILVTARHEVLTKQTAKVLGAAYLPKPFAMGQLRKLIAEMTAPGYRPQVMK